MDTTPFDRQQFSLSILRCFRIHSKRIETNGGKNGGEGSERVAAVFPDKSKMYNSCKKSNTTFDKRRAKMKRSILIMISTLVVLCMLLNPVLAKNLMNKESIKKLMMEYFQVYNSGDYQKVVSTYYTPDVIFESPEFKYVGSKDVSDFLVKSHRKGVTEKLKPINTLVDGKNAAIELLVEIEVFEDIPDFHIKPVKKGEIIRADLGVFYEIRDGKISHVKIYRYMKCPK